MKAMPPLKRKMTSSQPDLTPQTECLRRQTLSENGYLKSTLQNEMNRRIDLLRTGKLFRDNSSLLTVSVIHVAGVPSLTLIDSCAGSNTISYKNYKRIKNINEKAGLTLPPTLEKNLNVFPMGLEPAVSTLGDIVLPLAWGSSNNINTLSNSVNAQFLIIDSIPYDAIIGSKFISDWLWSLNPRTMLISHNLGQHIQKIHYSLMTHSSVCENSSSDGFERTSLPFARSLPRPSGLDDSYYNNSIDTNISEVVSNNSTIHNYESKNSNTDDFTRTSSNSGGTSPLLINSGVRIEHAHCHISTHDENNIDCGLPTVGATKDSGILFSDKEIDQFSKVWRNNFRTSENNSEYNDPPPSDRCNTTPRSKKPSSARALWRRLEKEIVFRANEKLKRAHARENTDKFIEAISCTDRSRINEKKIILEELSWQDIIDSYNRTSHIAVSHYEHKTVIDDQSGSIPAEEAIKNEPADLSWSAFERVGNDTLETNTYINGELSPNQKEKVLDILNNSSPLTSGSLGYLPLATKSMVHFDTGDSKPISVPPYRLKTPLVNKVRSTIDDLLKAGIIYRVTRSDWNSPVVLVDKPDGSIRLCIDFSRTLNTVVKPDNYPIPTVMDTLSDFHGAKFFTKIDCKNGYFGLLVAPEDQHKTAFTIPAIGTFQFSRGPMGALPMSGIFQRFMDEVIGEQARFGSDMGPAFCKAYQDDVIIYSNDFQSHLNHIRYIMDRFEKYNLTLKGSKCYFAHESLNMLGYEISQQGRRPDRNKVRAIANLAYPKCVKELQAFLGMIGYYRTHIKRLAELSTPLTFLLQKDIQFHFAKKQKKAFKAIKQELMKNVLLFHPDWTLPFRIQTDSSDYAISAILVQRHPLPEGTKFTPAEAKTTNVVQVDGRWYREQPISFLSKTLNRTQRNWSVREKEAFAVVYGCEKFAEYVRFTKFDVDTDHESLKFLWTDGLGGKIKRWSLALERFPGLTINYKAGPENINADAFSRLYTTQEADDCSINVIGVKSWHDANKKLSQDTPANLDDVVDNIGGGTLPVPQRVYETNSFIDLAPTYSLLMSSDVGSGPKKWLCSPDTMGHSDKLCQKYGIMLKSLKSSQVRNLSEEIQWEEYDRLILHHLEPNIEWLKRIKKLNIPIAVKMDMKVEDNDKVMTVIRILRDHFHNVRSWRIDDRRLWITWERVNSPNKSKIPNEDITSLFQHLTLSRNVKSIIGATSPDKIGRPTQQWYSSINASAIDTGVLEGPELELFRVEQREDPKWVKIIEYLEDLEEKGVESDETQDMHKIAQFYKLDKGLLYMRKNSNRFATATPRLLLLVPEKFRKEIIRRAHDHIWAGHGDKTRTYLRITRKYFWKGLFKQVERYVRECTFCKQNTSTIPSKAGVNFYRDLYTPFWEIGIDVFGGLPTTLDGYSKILTVFDTFSRWVEFIPLKTESAEEIAEKLVTEIFCRYGTPRRIISDRAQNLNKSELLTEIHKLLGIKKGLTAAHRPQTNGPTERVHRTLLKALRIYAEKNHSGWKHVLPYISFALRTSVSASFGYSPYEILFGRNPRLPTDLLTANTEELSSTLEHVHPFVQLVARTLRTVHTDVMASRDEEAEKRIALAENRIQRSFDVGDKILLFKSPSERRKTGVQRKLISPAKNCYVVIKKRSPYTYVLENTKTHRQTVAHVDRMLLDLATPYEHRLRELPHGWTGLSTDTAGMSENIANSMENLPLDEKKQIEPINAASHISTPADTEGGSEIPFLPPSSVVEDNKHDPDDPYSKIFKTGDLVIFDDVDGRNSWHLGEVLDIDGDTIEIHYYGANSTKNRHRKRWKRAWHDPRDEKDTYSMKKSNSAHQLYATSIDVDEVIMRVGNIVDSNSDYERRGISFTKKDYSRFDNLRKNRWRMKSKRSR